MSESGTEGRFRTGMRAAVTTTSGSLWGGRECPRCLPPCDDLSVAGPRFVTVMLTCAGDGAAKTLPCSHVDDDLVALSDATAAVCLMCGHFASPVRTTTCRVTTRH